MSISVKVLGLNISSIEEAQSRAGLLYSGSVKIEVAAPQDTGLAALNFSFPFQRHSSLEGAMMLALQSLKDYAEQPARSADKAIVRYKW
jgi:hypothetical protein